MNRKTSKIMYCVIRKSDKIIVPMTLTDKTFSNKNGGVGGGKGFD